MAEFSFQIFDFDDSQYLTEAEIEKFVKMVYGSRGTSVHCKNIMAKLDKNNDRKITKKEFIAGLLSSSMRIDNEVLVVCIRNSYTHRF